MSWLAEEQRAEAALDAVERAAIHIGQELGLSVPDVCTTLLEVAATILARITAKGGADREEVCNDSTMFFRGAIEEAFREIDAAGGLAGMRPAGRA